MSAPISSSTSLALQTYEPPARDRRVHLDDLSGVLELIVLASLVYAMRSLRRKELSLAQFTHAICMLSLLFIGGHFIEEHVLGVRKLEGLLKFGFQALSEDYSTPPRSGIVNLFRGLWELSGVFVACGGILYSRLWKCGHPEVCPSCIASSSSISAGQGLAGNGCGPVHLKCRLLRARLYLPIFCMWWCIIMAVVGARFNSLLGGSAIRPANDAYYFLAVCRSSPFIGVAILGATLSVYLMAELLEAELKPQVNDMFRCLAIEMENDDIVRSLLGQRFHSGHGTLFGISSISPNSGSSNRSVRLSEKKTPVHAASYINNDQADDISSGSFFISEEDVGNTPKTSPPASSSSFPTNSSWGAPSPNYQHPPASFQSQSQPQSQPTQSRSPPGSSNSLNQDFELKSAQAEAEAFAWARQQSAQQLQHQAMDEQLSRQIRSPSPQPMEDRLGGIQRGRLPPASAPTNQGLIRSISPTSRNRSMSPNLRRSISPSARGMRSASPPATTMSGGNTVPRVNVPASFSIFNRGDGDVSHLISSDSDDDDEGADGEEDRRAHAAMVGLYDDLGGASGGGLNNGVWPTANSSSNASPKLQPLSAPKGILLTRSNSGSSLTRSQSGSSQEAESGGGGLPQPLSSPTSSRTSSGMAETPKNISMTSMNQNRAQLNSSSYSPATKQAAMNAASAALQQGGIGGGSTTMNNSSDPSSPLTPVNLARTSYDSPGNAGGNSPKSSLLGMHVMSGSSVGVGNMVRGRPAGRSTSPFTSSERPASLTRSNADSSEDSDSDDSEEDEDDSELDVENTMENDKRKKETVLKVNNSNSSLVSTQTVKQKPLSPRSQSNAVNTNLTLPNNNNTPPSNNSNSTSDMVPLHHKPPPMMQHQESKSDEDGRSQRSSESENNIEDSSPSSVVALAKHGWKRFVDDSSGAAYWFNENSGESSWTKPIPTLG